MQGEAPFGGGFAFGSFYEYLQYIGDPVAIYWQPQVSLNAVSFILGDDDNVGTNYDINGDGVAEVAPYKDKTIFITGLRIKAPNGSASVGQLTVDGHVLLASAINGGGVIAMDGADLGNLTEGNSITDRFGGPIAWRHKMILFKVSTDQIPQAQANADVHIYGYAVPRYY